MSLKLSIDSSSRFRLTWRSQAAVAVWAGAPTAGMGRRREPLVRAWLGSKKARLCQPMPCSVAQRRAGLMRMATPTGRHSTVFDLRRDGAQQQQQPELRPPEGGHASGYRQTARLPDRKTQTGGEVWCFEQGREDSEVEPEGRPGGATLCSAARSRRRWVFSSGVQALRP